MRTEFLQLDESNAALLAFLNRWGLWDWTGALHRELFMDQIGKPERTQSPSLRPSLPNLEKEKGVRTAMLEPAEAWLTSNARVGALHRDARRFLILGSLTSSAPQPSKQRSHSTIYGP